MRAIPKITGRLQQIGQALHAHRDALNTNENKEVREELVDKVKGALKAYIETTRELGNANGIMREHIALLAEFDRLLASSGVSSDEAEAIAQPVEVMV